MLWQRRITDLVWIVDNLQRHHFQKDMEHLDVKPTYVFLMGSGNSLVAPHAYSVCFIYMCQLLRIIFNN